MTNQDNPLPIATADESNPACARSGGVYRAHGVAVRGVCGRLEGTVSLAVGDAGLQLTPTQAREVILALEGAIDHVEAAGSTRFFSSGPGSRVDSEIQIWDVPPWRSEFTGEPLPDPTQRKDRWGR